MTNIVFIKVLIGISGSGKSTYVRDAVKETNEKVCSTDKFVDEHAMSRFNEDGVKLSYEQAFNDIQENDMFKVITKKFYDEIEENIKSGDNFIIDRTNLSARARALLIKELRELGKKYGKAVVITGIIFNPSTSVILERLKQRIILENKRIPDNVLDDQIKYFEVPTKAEDFDILENIKNIWGKVYIGKGVTDN